MKIITKNKKAYFNYEIKSTFEAGVVLTGDEVKSIRQNNISLGDAFATVHDGQINLINCYIAPYSHSFSKTEEAKRSRRLLLKKREINKLIGDISKKGLTLVPLKVYINARGYIKIELGLAKHKKAFDKKKQIRDRDLKREASREIKQQVK